MTGESVSLFAGIELVGRPDLENVRKLDLLPIPSIRRMQRLGFAIDREYFWDLSSRFKSEMTELEKDIASYIPPDRLQDFQSAAQSVEEEGGDASFNPQSAEQIGTLLFDILGVGIGRELKKTAQGRVSTGKKQLELIKADHPVVRKVLDWRERAKLCSTYTDKLPRIAKFHPRVDCCPVCELRHDSDSWRVHGQIGTTRAATGRMNHKDPNLANIPMRSDNGSEVRAGFVAPAGKVLVSRDLSQIELRDLAHCANAQSMIRVYQEGKDIHVFTACAAFGLDYDYYQGLIKRDKKRLLTVAEKALLDDFKLTKRLPSKNLNFMIVYGATVIGLLAQLALSGLMWSEEEGNAFITRWFGLYPEVREYMERIYYLARRYGMSWDLFGRVRLIPETQSFFSWIREAGLRQAGNMPIQSVAAGQMKIAMGKAEGILLQLYDGGYGPWCWPLTTIHDQLIIEADEDVADDVQEMLGVAFDTCMEDEETGEHRFRVPIRSDGETVSRWVKD